MSQAQVLSNESVLYQALCAHYSKEVLSITTISRNTSGGRDFIVSPELALSFDNIFNCSSAYSFERNEKSPDALFFHNDTLFFVEFKEGKSKNTDKLDIRNKIHEGIVTLYHFARKFTAITRTEFLKLKIVYVVFKRPRNSINSFADAIQTASASYFLDNLKGFLVRATSVSDDPQFFVDFFHRVTSGRVTQIQIFDHNGSGTQTQYNAAAVQVAMSAPTNGASSTSQGGAATA